MTIRAGRFSVAQRDTREREGERRRWCLPAPFQGTACGGDRVRFCDRCQLPVHDLSGMDRDEAEALVLGQKGPLCMRFRRRPAKP